MGWGSPQIQQRLSAASGGGTKISQSSRKAIKMRQESRDRPWRLWGDPPAPCLAGGREEVSLQPGVAVSRQPPSSWTTLFGKIQKPTTDRASRDPPSLPERVAEPACGERGEGKGGGSAVPLGFPPFRPDAGESFPAPRQPPRLLRALVGKKARNQKKKTKKPETREKEIKRIKVLKSESGPRAAQQPGAPGRSPQLQGRIQQEVTWVPEQHLPTPAKS